MLSNFLVPLHRDGWKFVVLFFVATVLLGELVWSWLWLVGLLATAWCVYFFRDPPRVTPQRAGLVVSPADGLVSQVGSRRAAGRTRISAASRCRGSASSSASSTCM